MRMRKRRLQVIIIAAATVVIAVVGYAVYKHYTPRGRAPTQADLQQAAREFFSKAVEKGDLVKADIQRATVWMQAADWRRLNRWQKAAVLEKYSGMLRIIDGRGNITILSAGNDADLGSYTPTVDQEPVIYP